MKRILCFISALIFFACSNANEKRKQASQIPLSSASTATNQYHAWQEPDTLVEAIPEDSILINGKLPFYTTQKQLLKVLGRPDSIATYGHDCGGYFEDRKIKGYYYGKTLFEAIKDTAVLIEMDFTQGSFTFKTPKILFSSKTTLHDIERTYPESFKNSYELANEGYLVVAISPSHTGYDSTLAWHLLFKDNKLVKIEYYIRC